MPWFEVEREVRFQKTIEVDIPEDADDDAAWDAVNAAAMAMDLLGFIPLDDEKIIDWQEVKAPEIIRTTPR